MRAPMRRGTTPRRRGAGARRTRDGSPRRRAARRPARRASDRVPTVRRSRPPSTRTRARHARRSGERSRRRVAAGGAQVHHHDRPADHRADRYDDREDVGSEGVVQAHERVAALDDLSNGGLQRPSARAASIVTPSGRSPRSMETIDPSRTMHNAARSRIWPTSSSTRDWSAGRGRPRPRWAVGLEIEGVDGRVAPHLFGLAREVLFGERLEPSSRRSRNQSGPPSALACRQ